MVDLSKFFDSYNTAICNDASHSIFYIFLRRRNYFSKEKLFLFTLFRCLQVNLNLRLFLTVF